MDKLPTSEKTFEECVASALAHNTKKSWKAHRQGWIDLCTRHMTDTWNKTNWLKLSNGDRDIDKEILLLLATEEQVTCKKIATTLNVSRPTAGRRLQLLIEQGLISKSGKTRLATYTLK